MHLTAAWRETAVDASVESGAILPAQLTPTSALFLPMKSIGPALACLCLGLGSALAAAPNILLIVGEWYDKRSTAVIPEAAKQLLDSVKWGSYR